MRLGNLEIYPILDGFFRLDGGTIFGRVPKEVWKKTNPADKQNRILLSLRSVLIKTEKHNILIDTGIGDKHSPKIIERFAIYHKTNLMRSLFCHGLSPADIDIVINTHLHFDHCGGNTINKNQKIVPTFSRAKYIIQKGELETNYIQENLAPLKDYGLVEFINEDFVELDKGISLIKTGGHTKDHMIVKIESGGRTAYCLSDLVPTASHLNYLHIAAYDHYPLQTEQKKREILPEIARNKDMIFFPHEPNFDAAFIDIKGSKISVSATIKF